MTKSLNNTSQFASKPFVKGKKLLLRLKLQRPSTQQELFIEVDIIYIYIYTFIKWREYDGESTSKNNWLVDASCLIYTFL